MHGSSQTRLKRLSPEQKARIEGHKKRWAQIRTSTAPANREEAERGIAAAYEAGGLARAQPDRLVRKPDANGGALGENLARPLRPQP